ncbi:hypothetical protein [uncultured Mucilaginibacter sp.]|uniref:hypothetical protein n=1 Tax=uncultured Mucilaginibacter sp. TaxID=797541 RepID=UPI0026015BA1|nr:hypothetical protein [uncultured Mucilaginibacter sp.]
MLRNSFFKYYRVFKNDTIVTEVSANNFMRVPPVQFKRGLPIGEPIDVLISIPYFKYSLPTDENMFYGYLTKAKAMEKAKSGALIYINAMIADVEQSIAKLKAYRVSHYEDLNINLLDANIRRLEKLMNIK